MTGNTQGFCCLKNCYSCETVVCPPPDNDCYEAGKCLDGSCTDFIMRSDGSPCHSQLNGFCQKGTCVSGALDTWTIKASTNQPITNQPTPNIPVTNELPPDQSTPQITLIVNPKTTTQNIPITTTQIETQTTSPRTDIETITDSNDAHNETDAINNNNNSFTLEGWMIALIVVGSVIGFAIINITVLMLIPPVRKKIFIKREMQVPVPNSPPPPAPHLKPVPPPQDEPAPPPRKLPEIPQRRLPGPQRKVLPPVPQPPPRRVNL
jgi:hypothetical protein